MMRHLLGLGLVVLLWSVGCVKQGQVQKATAPGVERATFSLQKLSCVSCGARVMRVLKRHKGIHKMKFHKHKAELKLEYTPALISSDKIVKVIQDMGFVAYKGAGRGKYKASAKFDSKFDVKWIAKKGEAIELSQHLAKGKVTVFDFYAVWCGPCKDVDHAMVKLLEKYPKLALRKINIVDWNRPVAKKYLAKASALPYLVIYDAAGKKQKTLAGRKIDELKQTIARLHPK